MKKLIVLFFFSTLHSAYESKNELKSTALSIIVEDEDVKEIKRSVLPNMVADPERHKKLRHYPKAEPALPKLFVTPKTLTDFQKYSHATSRSISMVYPISTRDPNHPRWQKCKYLAISLCASIGSAALIAGIIIAIDYFKKW